MSTESLTPDTNPEAAEDAQEAPEGTATLAPDALARELEKARKEAAKYRTRLREREEAERAALEKQKQAEMTAEERARAAEQRAQEAQEAANQRVQQAERRAALAGKVNNPERVLRLMDDPNAYFTDSAPDLDAILRDFPEYAPQAPTPGAVRAPGAPMPATRSDRPLTPEDFRGKPPEWRAANIHRLKPA